MGEKRRGGAWLRVLGWWNSDDGWRHRALAYPWPRSMAIQLEAEAEQGATDYACRALREWREQELVAKECA